LGAVVPPRLRGAMLLVVVVKDYAIERKLAGHTGHSSQLFCVATARNAQFLATIQIDLNVSHTGKDYHEFDNSNPLITIVT
jgi:hypothetical protein